MVGEDGRKIIMLNKEQIRKILEMGTHGNFGGQQDASLAFPHDKMR